MTDHLRQRLNEAIDDCRTLTPEALTDVVLGVVQPELVRLRSDQYRLTKAVDRRGKILRSMQEREAETIPRIVEICKDRDAARAAIERVRALHQPIQHMGKAWCAECSVRRSTGAKTCEWVAYIPHPCPTIDATEEA